MPTQQWREQNVERARKYRRDYYRRNAEAQKAAASRNQVIYRQRHREIIRAEKDKPCADCGLEYPYYVMHFDHVAGDKTAAISNMSSVSEAKLRAEIAKCEVVCGNCHAVRTHTRLQAQE